MLHQAFYVDSRDWILVIGLSFIAGILLTEPTLQSSYIPFLKNLITVFHLSTL